TEWDRTPTRRGGGQGGGSQCRANGWRPERQGTPQKRRSLVTTRQLSAAKHLMSDSPKDRGVPCGNGLAKMRIGRCLYRALCLPCVVFHPRNLCRRLRGCNPSRVSAPMQHILGNRL